MEGVIFDFKHFSVNDGPGIRLTVFFKGCPLRCHWCHNPESFLSSIEFRNQTDVIDNQHFTRTIQIGQLISVPSLLNIILTDLPFFSKSGGGVTFSGGEPLMQINFLREILIECKLQGIHTCLDTSGFAEIVEFESVLNNVDLLLFDLKVMDPKLHKQLTGVDNLPILNNLHLADKQNIPIRIRIPLIPKLTDTEENLNDILQFIKPLKNIHGVDLLPFHSMSKSKYYKLKMKFPMEIHENYSIQAANHIAEMYREWFSDVTVGG